MVALTPDSLVADRFRLVCELGRGGMGAVWRAHHVRLGVPCAVKFILGEAAADPELRSRFEMEAQAAAQIKSPHVVQILDHGVWQDTPYIAMELLEGEDLEKRLEKRGRLDIREVSAIVSQVARALGKAHAAGLIHRDLKPANIFLCHDEDGLLVKILDFGIAKHTQGGPMTAQTKSGVLLGTPYYMSPEHARGTTPVDYRSDLWSLAVIVYQCMTGQLPFESPAIGDLLVKIMFHPLPVPSQVASVPRGFDAFWARAACREPDGRFESARAFAEALAQVAGVPPLAEGQRYAGELSFSSPDPARARTEVSAVTPGRYGASGRSRAWIAPVAVVLFVLAAGGAFLVARGSGADTTPVVGADTATDSGAPPSGSPGPVVTPGTSIAPSAAPLASSAAPSATVSAAPTAPASSAGKPGKTPLPRSSTVPLTPVPKHHDDGI